LHFAHYVKQNRDMPNRSRNTKADFAQTALKVAEIATGTPLASFSGMDRKRIMAEMGSIGGKIGGRRRAAKMTPEARRASASLAAQARWAGKTSPDSVKLKREAGLRKIAQILEQHMTELGLSEEERNEKTAQLMAVVTKAVTARLKSPARSQEAVRASANRA